MASTHQLFRSLQLLIERAQHEFAYMFNAIIRMALDLKRLSSSLADSSEDQFLPLSAGDATQLIGNSSLGQTLLPLLELDVGVRHSTGACMTLSSLESYGHWPL